MNDRVSYKVTAEVVKEHKDEYIDWLKSGHLQAVLNPEGLSAEIIVLEDPSSNTNTIKIMSSYVFPSRESLERYFEQVAPLLREDGKEWLTSGRIQAVLHRKRLSGEVTVMGDSHSEENREIDGILSIPYQRDTKTLL